MPLVASILVGVGVKVGLGLAATAGKKLMEPATATRSAASFPSLLEANPTTSASAPSAASGIAAAQPLARMPYDLPGRLAAERLHGLALDVEAHRGVPAPGLTAAQHARGPLAAYRRLDQAPS